MNVFRAAISPTDNTVDPGYLAMYWALVGWSISSTFVLVEGFIAIWRAPADVAAFGQVGPLIQNIGIALGAIAGGFATVVGAVGLFRAGDKEHPK